MANGFCVRFCFQIRNQLNIRSREYRFRIGERDVTLSGQTQESLISDETWLVMNAKGFESEQEARRFASRLKTACELSSAGCQAWHRRRN